MIKIGKGYLALCLLLLFVTSARAQDASDQYFKHIEDTVVAKLNPTKIYRREVFGVECAFEFTVAEDDDVNLYVEIYDTDDNSRESLQTYLLMIAPYYGVEDGNKIPLDKFDTSHGWDEIYFSKKKAKMDSGFLLLRKGRLAVKMLSSKDEHLIRMEHLLGNELFDSAARDNIVSPEK